ncbi:GNAT family N-acetyltransferase [Methylorubrum extorquens]|uniref:GNAT family N-acetyltransferase n=1 Tax=Methylorubrum extorquens TaxID=408 RepID=UPI002237E1A4|nr:GNAT family N-acetyltransferase [Methylorubrum extorquens]UYW30150.1 GNAT family N-acetyltransferase [Methylorubrum extorquens]
MEKRAEPAAILHNIKYGSAEWRTHFIYSLENQPVGTIIPVTQQIAGEGNTAEMLCRWREKYMNFFLTVFKATTESTRSYLNNLYLPDDMRIMFLLKEGDRFVGNFGLANVEGQSAELDNMIRGEEVTTRGFMHQAQISLMNWASSSLGTKYFYLHVLSNNHRTIMHHERIGFKIKSDTPLKKEIVDGGYKLVTGRGFDDQHLSLVRMEMMYEA